ncbi:MAG: TetR/AcrR family transcriptional regulator [Gammaproteobacteria bacterium]|jgi:AcrR family transcriptional regulator|nr:MAG: TetR/AcrR family transcriptional regulator [Gammaproteobacteria bacterium]
MSSLPTTKPAEASAEPESRVARKRRKARERIISAAEQLMRTKPIEEVTIGDITSAADVGHGTFYLHFKSKYEVLLPIVRAAAEQWDHEIQQHLSECRDPAEVVGLSTRYMGRRLHGDPLWRWLLKEGGLPIELVKDAIGRFSARDFGRGLLSGRFQVTDLQAANNFMGGGFVAGMLASFDAQDPGAAIDHMAELILRTMGLDVADAARIAYQPLTPLPEPEDDPTKERELNGEQL